MLIALASLSSLLVLSWLLALGGFLALKPWLLALGALALGGEHACEHVDLANLALGVSRFS